MTTVDQHTATVTLGQTIVSAKDCGIRLDRRRAPFVSSTVSIPMNLGIDPRKGDRVRVSLRQVFGESVTAAAVSAAHPGTTAAAMSTLWAGKTAAEISALHFTPWNRFGVRSSTNAEFDLVVAAVQTNAARKETELTVTSDELLAQWHALVQVAPMTFGSLSVRAIASQVLARMGAWLLDGDADGLLEEPATWEPGVSAWDFLAPLVQQAGLRLWCDGRRSWRLDADTSPGATGTITLSSRGRVTDATIGTDLSDETGWADAVVIRYRWRDSNGIDQTRYDVAGKTRPMRALRLDYDDTRYPGPGAAAQVLRRLQRRGVSAPVDAVSDYSVRPDMGFLLSLDGLDQQAGSVQAVEWRISESAVGMTVTPVDLESINPQGIRAIPSTYRILDLPGTIAQLVPGNL